MFVTLVLDRSASMDTIRDKTIEGCNSYITGLREQPTPKEKFFTLIQFDNIAVDVVHRAVPIADVPMLTRETYSPRGYTPLIDACVKSIKATAEKATLGSLVTMVIQTDGQENASREFKLSDLQDLIKEKTLAGWHFIFLGVGPEAFDQARQMGVMLQNTMSYDMNNIGQTFAAVRRSTSSYGETGQSALAGFTNAERNSAGGAMPTPDPTPDAAPTPPAPVVGDITI